MNSNENEKISIEDVCALIGNAHKVHSGGPIIRPEKSSGESIPGEASRRELRRGSVYPGVCGDAHFKNLRWMLY